MWHFWRPSDMSRVALCDGVLLTLANTPRELAESIDALPDGVRYGVACDLDETGHALRYESSSQHVYCLVRDDDGVRVWCWGPMESCWEAAILLSLIRSLEEPLNDETAISLFHQSTNRRPDLMAPARRPWPRASASSWVVPLAVP